MIVLEGKQAGCRLKHGADERARNTGGDAAREWQGLSQALVGIFPILAWANLSVLGFIKAEMASRSNKRTYVKSLSDFAFSRKLSKTFMAVTDCEESLPLRFGL